MSAEIFKSILGKEVRGMMTVIGNHVSVIDGGLERQNNAECRSGCVTEVGDVDIW